MKSHIILLLFLLLFGCSQQSTDYIPLGEKIKWEYHFQKELGNNQSSGKSIVSQLDSIRVDGVRFFPHRYANGEILYYSKNENGIQLSSKPEQKEGAFIKLPLTLNTNWTRETRIELLNSRHESFSGGESFISQGEKIILDSKVVSLDDTITVAASVFTNVMRIESRASVTVIERTRGIDQILIEQTEWYAKGVGLIKRSRKEISVPEKYNAKQLTELLSVERY